MENDQKINCTVSSCKYNNNQMQKCKLQSIIVTPVEGVNTQIQMNQCAQAMIMNKKRAEGD